MVCSAIELMQSSTTFRTCFIYFISFFYKIHFCNLFTEILYIHWFAINSFVQTL
mgnify:CR=1 FL=1